jgi:uncharacterized protein YdiU (UPF0061 family)
MNVRSKALKRQDIMNAIQSGVFQVQDPKIRETIVDALEFGDTDELFKDHALSMAQIKNDIDLIKKEEIPQVNELDNHSLHLVQKNQVRIQNQINPFLSDYSKLILDHNIEAHLQMVMNMSNPGMQMDEQMAQEMAKSANDPNVLAQAQGMASHPGNPAQQQIKAINHQASQPPPPPQPQGAQ